MKIWIIPANTKYYNVQDAFDHLQKLDWKQSFNANIGDIVYIYVSKPYSAIMYKCRINKVDLPSVEIDDRAYIVDGKPYQNYGRHMELELLKKLDSGKYSIDILRQNGIKSNIQGPRGMPD